MNNIITETNFEDLKLYHRGKVRDVYDLGNAFLIVATDRISAFDVVFNEGIPDKGKILTQISKYWFELTKNIIENHIISFEVEEYPTECLKYKNILFGRSMLVKKTKPILIEAVIRGYLSGSGWNEYKNSNSVCGVKLENGLLDSSKLSEPIFTPATKEAAGKHDENISFERMKEIVGIETSEFVKHKGIEIYNLAYKHALENGIIIADTKMEFGFYENKIILIDELLTPDSSRFWPMDEYQSGRTQKSLDKQFVREYLISINFNKKPPAPKLPQIVIENTSKIYHKAYKLITGRDLN
ncbi:MAG: phosphoribosylaminoimidazolesuccinocarboxamide synthase [Ignavibacteria bacterium]|nr:phosphoribosylaminoimidazolesuccinocarboxamide synthase [Bacteroidota bacterium]MSQ46250.1 phosphoribosylaminoimidazolesuccinocarboxamide synthase [Ignavibacteria bacterium]